MVRRSRHLRAVACALTLCLAPLAAGAADLIETALESKQSGRYKIDHFGIALETAGLEPGSYTVFAPTNQVFRRLDLGAMKPGGPAMSPEERIRAADKDLLLDVVEAHIVEGALPYSELAAEETVTTLGGTTLEITRTEGGVLVGEVTITKPDLTADDGVIHVIDGLLAGGRQR
ncbi:MAG: fasciclin domain-containing protein [Geminicoccaceae bacterium]|nr:fasciclin domain-containing protein [Geminicoccaceae bacterium]